MQGLAIILSGPSGVGKSTIVRQAGAQLANWCFSVSCTTRAPRPGEVDGKDYHFYTKERFEQEIAASSFLEWAEVHGNYYGTLRLPVQETIQSGGLMILDIDVQGARQIRTAIAGSAIEPSFVTVFVAPPSMTELERRLRGRGTETEESIQKRLKNARTELAALDEYQFCVVNDKLEQAASDFLSIVQAARCRTPLQKANLPLFD
ncbi:MAG: guanylate kinase [Victivallales bacterium]|nr:guanylate kinase [Victivallales bacterium]